jgi:hypothetical protein
MKYSNFFVILLLLCLNSISFAQNETPFDKGVINLGGNASYSSYQYDSNENYATTIKFNPQIGYLFIKKLSADVGVASQFDSDDNQEISILLGNRFFLGNAYAGYAYNRTMYNQKYYDTTIKSNANYLSLKGGYLVKVVENVFLDMGINYQMGIGKYGGDWIGDNNTRNLSLNIGFQAFLGSKSGSNSSAQNTDRASKRNSQEQSLLLDDSRLEDNSYYAMLQTEAIASIVMSATLIGKSDFTSIYDAYMMANEDIAWSKETALQALGLRQDVVRMRADAAGAGAGNAGAIGSEIGANMQQVIDANLQSGLLLSEVQKKYFLVSLTRLGAAIAKEIIIVKNATDYVQDVKKMSAIQKAKEAKNLPKAVDMVSKLPGNITSQLNSLKTYIDVAKTNNINIPDDVTKLLD